MTQLIQVGDYVKVLDTDYTFEVADVRPRKKVVSDSRKRTYDFEQVEVITEEEHEGRVAIMRAEMKTQRIEMQEESFVRSLEEVKKKLERAAEDVQREIDRFKVVRAAGKNNQPREAAFHSAGSPMQTVVRVQQEVMGTVGNLNLAYLPQSAANLEEVQREAADAVAKLTDEQRDALMAALLES